MTKDEKYIYSLITEEGNDILDLVVKIGFTSKNISFNDVITITDSLERIGLIRTERYKHNELQYNLYRLTPIEIVNKRLE